MARTHGRIYSSIWADADFRRLRKDDQRAYVMLVTQPQINNCGVLPFVPKRWVRLAVDETDQELMGAIGHLVAAAFVVLDEATDELLIRTFIKHDRIEKQPQLRQAARREFTEIESSRIQQTLLLEYPEIFGDLAELDPEDGPLPEPLFDQSVEGSPQDSAEGSAEGSLARATRTHARAPAPTPAPSSEIETISEESRRPRKRDDLWDVLELELGTVVTKTERGKRNAALKELREIGATPDEVRRKIGLYRSRWPSVELTANALVKHWSQLERPAPAQSNGLSAGDLLEAARGRM